MSTVCVRCGERETQSKKMYCQKCYQSIKSSKKKGHEREKKFKW